MKFNSIDLEQFKQKLDRISGDIKNIQQLFRDTGISIPISVFCKTEIEFKGIDSEETGPNGPELHKDKYLIWDMHKTGNKTEWFLLYEEREQAGYIECDGPILIDRCREGVSELIIRKPLIETQAQIRIEMYEYLDEFLKEISNKVRMSGFAEVHKKIQAQISNLAP